MASVAVEDNMIEQYCKVEQFLSSLMAGLMLDELDTHRNSLLIKTPLIKVDNIKLNSMHLQRVGKLHELKCIQFAFINLDSEVCIYYQNESV